MQKRVIQAEACRDKARARCRPKWAPKTPPAGRRCFLNAAKSKRNQRICVLVRGQEWSPVLPGRACPSSIHGHMTLGKAQELADQGLAEWIKAEKITAKGKVMEVTVPAIRLTAKRRWKAKVSGGDGGPMKVMQLVRC